MTLAIILVLGFLMIGLVFRLVTGILKIALIIFLLILITGGSVVVTQTEIPPIAETTDL